MQQGGVIDQTVTLLRRPELHALVVKTPPVMRSAAVVSNDDVVKTIRAELSSIDPAKPIQRNGDYAHAYITVQLKLAQRFRDPQPESIKFISDAAHAAHIICSREKEDALWDKAGELCARFLDTAIKFREEESAGIINESRLVYLKLMQKTFAVNRYEVPKIINECRNATGMIERAQILSFARKVLGIAFLISRKNASAGKIKSHLDSLKVSITEMDRLAKGGKEFVTAGILALSYRIEQIIDDRSQTPATIANRLVETISKRAPKAIPKDPRLKVYQFSNSDFPDGFIEQLESINRKLTIDPKLMTGQNGFGREVLSKEMKAWFKQTSSKILALYYNDKLVGYYGAFTNLRDAKSERDLFGEMAKLNLLGNESDLAWANIVGILPTARKKIKKGGSSPYPILHTAMVQLFKANTVGYVVGKCRSGLQANTSISRHVAKNIGWRILQKDIMEHGTPYHMLGLDLYGTPSTKLIEAMIGLCPP